MTTITAAAGGGNWSAGGSWVGGIAPTAANDVLLTVASGSITIDGTSGAPNLCRSLDCTGFTATLTAGATAQLNIGDGTSGAFKLAAGMTFTPNAAALLKFVSTTTGNNITSAGKSMPSMTFDGVGGSWQFQDTFASAGSTQVVTLTNGTLDMNGKTVALGSFSSIGSATRTLTLGAAQVTSNAGTSAWVTNATLTVTANTSTITLNAQNGEFFGGGLTWNNLVFTGAGTNNLSGANTFANLTKTGTAAKTNILTLLNDQIVTGTFTCNGNSAINRILVCSDTFNTQRTITCNTTVTVTNSDFQDIVGAGSASWNLSAITGGSGNCGGNSGITFNTPKNCFMKTAGSVNWSGSNWFTTSGGSTPVGTTIPLPQDTAIFDANSVTAGSVTITNDMPRISGMDWNGVLNTPAFASGATDFLIFGGVRLVSGMTHTGAGDWYFEGRSTFNIDGGGLTWPSSSLIFINAPGGTHTFTTAFTSNSSITETLGNITTNSTLSCTSLTISAGTFTVGGNITLTSALSVTGTMTDGTGTTYSISGGTTLSVPVGGSLTIGTFSGTSSTNAILGTAVIGTLTLSGSFTMTSGSGACTIGSGGMTANALTVSASGSSFTSGSGLISLTTTATFSGGTITLGSGGLTCTALSVSSATTRTINLGSGNITLNGTGALLTTTTLTGLTFNAQTSTIVISDTSATTKTFGGSTNTLTFNNIRVNGAASNGTVTFAGAFTANIMTFDADSSIIWTKATTYTVSGLVSNGSSGHVVTFATNTAASAATLSCANPVNVDWMSIKDSTASGNTPFYAGANSTNVSGNTNWTFTVRPSAANSNFFFMM